jgi:hypothetical protein
MKAMRNDDPDRYSDLLSVVGGLLLVAVSCYVLSLPFVFRLMGGNVPDVYLPAARLLNTPLHGPYARYLELCGVDWGYVECASY